MAEIWDYFKGLFKKAEISSPSRPLIHEMIERSEEEKTDYEYWKNTLVCRRLKNWLNEQYVLFQVEPQRIDEAIDFLDTPSSQGFVVHFSKTRYSRRDVVHFFDYLKEQVLQINYRTQISDARSYERPQWVESVQRHYLKPRPAQTEGGLFDQQFGNVMIELTFRNDHIHNLKFRATSYRDYQYTEVLEFRDLVKKILL
jgi:hypothetical protein